MVHFLILKRYSRQQGRFLKYDQTSPEISSLGSPKDSKFYSICRFLYQKAILRCHQNPVIAPRVQNRLQIIWISIEAHATLEWIPIRAPILSTVDIFCIEQTSPLWGVMVWESPHVYSYYIQFFWLMIYCLGCHSAVHSMGNGQGKLEVKLIRQVELGYGPLDVGYINDSSKVMTYTGL